MNIKNSLLILSLILIQSCQSSNKKNLKKPDFKNNSGISSLVAKIKKLDEKVLLGASIMDLDSNKMLLNENSNKFFTPASSIKAVTAAAALYYLGPDFRFETSIYATEINKKGEAKDIYIKGSGDPSLMETDMIMLARELTNRGIIKITGNIFIDDQIFDSVPWGTGAMWDDRMHGYAAPVYGLNINYNRLDIIVRPSFFENTKAHVSIIPNTDLFNIKNNGKTSLSAHNVTVPLLPKENSKDKQGLIAGDEIAVIGNIKKNIDNKYTTFAVKDASVLAASVFIREANKEGIKILNKEPARGQTEINAIKIASHSSRQLSELLVDFVKISNNMALDALVKTIAVNEGSIPGSYHKGMALIKEFLQKEIGINQNDIRIVDGSGLSRYNLLSPDQFIKLLAYTYNNFQLFPEFITCLPIVGLDGNLKNRYKSDDVRGRVRAKGGYLSGISSLVGYASDGDKTYAFAFMMNGIVGPVAPFLKAQEEILSYLTRSNINDIVFSQAN